MTTLEHQAIKRQLLDDLNTIEREIKELQDLTKPISPECALGSLGRFELMNDQDIYEKTLKEALNRQTKLNYALTKIDNEDFGLCVECDEPISFDRLLLLPESTHCMECLQN